MSFDGLPLHPLVVHAVVVLLPLATIGTVVVALRPSWRRTYGPVVLAVAVAGLASVVLARDSGEDLADAVHHASSALDAHMARADFVLPAAIVYVLLLVFALFTGHRGHQIASSAPGVVGATRVATILTVLAAAAGLVTTGLVLWTGHAGATATWSGTIG